jgi:DNA transformation protein
MSPLRDQDFLDFVLDQLSGLRRVTHRRMFGAIGLYQGDSFFAIIDEGRLYFLTGESTRPRYEARGMKAFQYAPGKFLHTYYEVPVDVLEDDGALCQWALEAVDVQRTRSTKGRKRRKKQEGGS